MSNHIALLNAKAMNKSQDQKQVKGAGDRQYKRNFDIDRLAFNSIFGLCFNQIKLLLFNIFLGNTQRWALNILCHPKSVTSD